MIGKARSIAHGINNIMYISGESKNKKHLDKIIHVKNNLMDSFLDAKSIWEKFKDASADHKRLVNKMIRIEVSPAKEYTTNFSHKDWEKLWDDFLDEFDSIELFDKKGNLTSGKTNLKNSMATVWVHYESDSGIPHLHAAVARVDKDGNVNNDHYIGDRAQKAAECIAKRRGWITAAAIHEKGLIEATNDVNSILLKMRIWAWDEYLHRLKCIDYDVRVRRDKEGIIRGYTLKKGSCKFKASELGKAREYTASRIENTWWKIHGKEHVQTTSSSPAVSEDRKPNLGQEEERRSYPNPRDYMFFKEGRVPVKIMHKNRENLFYIPKEIARLFEEEFNSKEASNLNKEQSNFALALFVGLLLGPKPQIIVGSGGGGGGNSDDDKKKKKKDEDELEWARRCARYAKIEIRPKQRPRYRKRKRR